jgi:hypothetical protein
MMPWDPQEALRDDVREITAKQPVDRRVPGPPPRRTPVDAVTPPIQDQAEAAVLNTDTTSTASSVERWQDPRPDGLEAPRIPESTSAPSPIPVPVAPSSARPRVPTAVRGTRPRPSGRTVGIAIVTIPVSADVPTEVVNRLKLARMDAEVARREFNISMLLTDVILDLPLGAELVQLVDAHEAQLNLGRRRLQDGYVPRTRMSYRVTEPADIRLAELGRSYFTETSTKLAKADLVALSAIRLLSSL